MDISARLIIITPNILSIVNKTNSMWLFLILSLCTFIAAEKENGYTNRTNHGVLITLDSSFSNVYVFSWGARVWNSITNITYPDIDGFFVQPFGINVETSINANLQSNLEALAEDSNLVDTLLEPLIQFSTKFLGDYSDYFSSFPIYFKGMSSLRSMPPSQRNRIIQAVRSFLFNKTSCPFYFEFNFARAISGIAEIKFNSSFKENAVLMVIFSIPYYR